MSRLNRVAKISSEATFNIRTKQLFFAENGKLKGGLKGNIALRKAKQLLVDGIDVEFMDDAEEEKKRLIIQFHAILNKKGIMEFKKDILAGYGVESTKDLSIAELSEIITKYNSQEAPKYVRDARSKVLCLMQNYGINTTNWDWVNVFCSDKRIAGKKFWDLSIEELRDLEIKMYSLIDKKRKDESL